MLSGTARVEYSANMCKKDGSVFALFITLRDEYREKLTI
jgi:hypothetical protein